MIIPVIVKGEADAEKKSCKDCYWCQGAVGWWCMNEETKKARGALIPGISNCSFWKPATHINDLPWYKRIFTDYIGIDCSKKEE